MARRAVPPPLHGGPAGPAGDLQQWAVRLSAGRDKPLGWEVLHARGNDASARPNQRVLCEPTSAGQSVWLPAAEKDTIGTSVLVKNITANDNTITVRTVPGDAIDGGTAMYLRSSWEGAMFVAAKKGLWIVIAHYVSGVVA